MMQRTLLAATLLPLIATAVGAQERADTTTVERKMVLAFDYIVSDTYEESFGVWMTLGPSVLGIGMDWGEMQDQQFVVYGMGWHPVQESALSWHYGQWDSPVDDGESRINYTGFSVWLGAGVLADGRWPLGVGLRTLWSVGAPADVMAESVYQLFLRLDLGKLVG